MMNIKAGGTRPKYRIPRLRRGTVKRARLFKLLDEAIGRPITLVNAAGGSGKTSLVASWLLCHALQRAGWLRLDAEDRDPLRLLRHLWSCARNAIGDSDEFSPATEELFRRPGGHSVATLVEALSTDLAGLRSPLALVLDDYHEADGPDAHDVMARLIDDIGPGVAFIVLSRGVPDLPIAVWQARGEVTLLSQADLAFSGDEALDFLQSTMGLDIEIESGRLLQSKTEGWVAGLQLAALSLQSSTAAGGEYATIDEAARHLTARNHFIKDYLSEDFIDRLDSGTIAFLEQTSIVDSLCASLCNALTGRHDGAELLRELERRNLFTVPLDVDRDWYRYHDLFREFLIDRLAPAMRSQLHLRAAEWFAARSQFEDATRHVKASRDTLGIVAFVRRHAEAIMGDSFAGDLLNCIAALPADAQATRPDIMGIKAWLLYLRGTEREAEPAASIALSRRDDASMQTGLMLAFRAYCALRWEGPGDVASMCTAALQRLAPESRRLRSLMLSYRGQAWAQAGLADEAIASYLQSLQPDASSDETDGMAGTVLHLVELLLERGRAAEARGIAHDFLVRPRHAAHDPRPSLGPAFVAMAMVRFAANELAAAKEAAQLGLVLVDRAGLVFFRLFARTTLAQVLHALGDRPGAWALLDEARQLSQRTGGHSRRRMVQATMAELHCHEGNAALAAHAMSEIERLPMANPADCESLLQGRWLILQKRHREASAVLLPIATRARNEGYVRTAIEVGILLARACEQLGDRSGAQHHLTEALVDAAAGRYLRLFIEAGAGLSPLLVACASAAPDFVAEIAQGSARSSNVACEPSPAGLTRKDLEVLTLISRGLQNKEIADALIVTIGTTKQYVNRLYMKLGTRNRVEAVSEGRRLHLIP